MEKTCDVILVTVFDDVIMMASSLKWRHYWFFKDRFLNNQFEKPEFGQITQLQVNNIKC